MECLGDHQGWNIFIEGLPDRDVFDITIKPTLENIVNLSLKTAALALKKKIDWKFIEKDDYENKVAGHFLGKLREVEFSFHITVPSGLFTTYNSRKKDAEKKAINYIDSKLGNFIAWVIQHEEILH